MDPAVEIGRESCRIPGMAHKARNCASGHDCQHTGVCGYAAMRDNCTIQSAQMGGNFSPISHFREVLGDALAGELDRKILGEDYDYNKDHCVTEPVRKVEDFQGAVDGAGYKGSMDNPKKLPLWLVPAALIRGTAAVLAYGAKKYASNNWRRGMAYSEVYSALQRHLTSWNDGEENDDESNLNHLKHAACNIAFLLEYEENRALYGRFDDRFKRPAPTTEG